MMNTTDACPSCGTIGLPSCTSCAGTVATCDYRCLPCGEEWTSTRPFDPATARESAPPIVPWQEQWATTHDPVITAGTCEWCISVQRSWPLPANGLAIVRTDHATGCPAGPVRAN